MTHSRRRKLGDERVGVEALELERLDQLRRLPGRDQLGERDAVIGAALKPYVPQPQSTRKPSISVTPMIGL